MPRHALLLTLALCLPAACDGGATVPTASATVPEIALNREWAERAFSGEAAGPAGVDRLAIVHEDMPGDTKVNTCSFASRPPIRLGERTYARGIGVNSTSVLRVALSRPAARFLAEIGLDRNVDGTVASVRFHVAAGDEEVFATDVIRPGAQPLPIDAPLAGAREVLLTVDDGGDGRGWDQADWADARVLLEDGSVLWLDDLARSAAASADVPFSFVYGGRSSRELLPGWERAIEDRAVDATRWERVLTFRDPETGLTVRAVCTVYLDTAGVDWTIHFANTGTADTPALEAIRTLDTRVALGLESGATLHRLKGSTGGAEDWLPFDQALPAGARVAFAPPDGKPSQAVSPFYTVSWAGGGVTTAIGWSGQWAAAVANEDGALRLEAGIQTAHLSLRPGASIRGPRVLQIYWRSDPADPSRPYNLFRRTMRAHVTPRVDGEPIVPPIVHLGSSFYEMNATTERTELDHLKAVEGLGFEYYWLDAYWTKGGFPEGMGNYGFPLSRVEPADRFPRGIAPIGEAVRAAGMGFVLWFEPERVAANTEIAREHPEWVVSPSGNGGMFDLGNPEAREYMTRYLIEAIRAYRVGCLRIDYNFGPLGYWRFVDAKDANRVGISEIRYVEGLYRMWDDILAACPGLFIDNCASGGMRIDLETCSRSVPLWRTDGTIGPLFAHDFDQAAIQNQVMTEGLGRYVPLSTSGMMGASRYWFRSGFNGGISFCEDVWQADYPRERLAAAIAEGKRLRKYYEGDLHPGSDPTMDPKAWCVLQWDRPEEGDGMVVAFRRHASPYTGFGCHLAGIDPEARYEVTTTGEDGVSRTLHMAGSGLAALTLEIPERPGSVVVEYRRK